MAEILIEILGAVVSKLVEYSVDPIKKQVSYLCCYSCNVKQLDDEVSKLEIDKKTLEERIERARVEWGDIVHPADVDDWLAKVKELQGKSNEIRNEKVQVQQGSLSKWIPFLHYSLSRRARKTTEAVAERRNPTFETIAYPARAAELEPIPATCKVLLESRKSIEDEIMDALKKKDIYLIGICGMGGVGKTTMAENIEKMVRERTEDSGFMFECVVKAVVSQEADLSKIQQKIAERLGLSLEEEDLEIRAERLHAGLKHTQSVLIILDDLWDRLNLQKIGIPSQNTHPGCKLILTSRDQRTITSTAEEDVKIFHLQVLDDEEAWVLFRKNAGNSIDSLDLHQIAKQVAKECNGLPLALETVGRALKGQSKSCWEDALLGLRQAMPGSIPDVVKGVYGPLLWSLDRLESEEHRYLFLLCCLFPEDSEISLEELVSYGMGLGIFEGIEDLNQARNRVESIAGQLISRSLLLESSDWGGNPCVTMHDVVRDLGIHIKKHEFFIRHGKEEWPKLKEDYTWISLMFSKHHVGVPERVDCPRLELLRMNCTEYLDIPDNFFSRIRELKVVDFFRLESMPSSIHLLNGLRTLHLRWCHSGMISVIGELVNLEILCLEHCGFIEVLPQEIGGLKKLRKLEVMECYSLKRIAFGVLSGLLRLEVLVIDGNSFGKWEAEEKDKEVNSNASLVELDSLSHLNVLSITILNPNTLPKAIPLWVHQLKKYSICVRGRENFSQLDFYDLDLLKFQKLIFLGDIVIPLEDWFYVHLTRNARYMELYGSSCACVVNWLIQSGFQNLEYFKLHKGNNAKCLSHTVLEGRDNGAMFPVLKELDIQDFSSLEALCKGPPPVGSFKALEKIGLENLSGLMHLWTFSSEKLHLSNLKSIRISNCESLVYLFPLPIAESLSQLEEIKLSNCPVLKEIFKREDQEGMEIVINKITLPKLDKLILEDLPSLCGCCNAADEIEVPLLGYLRIANLQGIVREADNQDYQQFLFHQQVASKSLQLGLLLTPLSNFNGLQKLEIGSLNNVKSLFSPSLLSTHFPNLRCLDVQNCSELEQVIGKEETEQVAAGETKTKTILFPQLQELTLQSLPKLLAFCQNITGDLELPLLRDVRIGTCTVMKAFCHGMGNIGLPSLEGLSIHSCPMMATFCNGTGNIKLPSLRRLWIQDCSVMESIFHSIGNLELPSLERVVIRFCPVMETFARSLSNVPVSIISTSEPIIQPFFSEQVLALKLETLELDRINAALLFSRNIAADNFCGLQDLSVRSCNRIANLFSFPISRGLTNIRQLYLYDCKELQEVIAKEDHQEPEPPTNIIDETLFPQLQHLVLMKLPKMQRFCHLKSNLELPSLEKVTIEYCPILETFSLGNLHLPSFKRLDGLLDRPDFAAKVFFHKEKASHETHLDSNCFTIYARELSLNSAEKRVYWVLSPDSSDSFYTAAELHYFRSLEITGRFEMVKLLPGVVYEIILIILDYDPKGWEESVLFRLTLPGEVPQYERKFRDKKPSGEWVEILLGEFTREPHQIGELEFFLSLKKDINEPYKALVLIKGIILRLKV